ncbi:MAG: rod-binding protein [Planctomycetota bacterium]|nr:rod-binding protein [Planctomycetota bacterium]
MNPLSPITPNLPAASVSSVERGGKGASAIQVAKDFESILLTKVVEEMAKTVETSDLADDGAGQQVYDLFYSQLGQDLAAKGGFGLWKQIARQIGASPAATEPAQEPLP